MVRQIASAQVQRILDKLSGVVAKPNGGWKALCPCHDDQHPSLEIDQNRDGQPLILCRVCGRERSGEILRAIGLEWSEVLREQEPTATARPRPGKRQIVASFDYRDEAGVLRYQACRVEPGRDGKKKEFFQRRPLQITPTGKVTRWANDLDGVTRLLYRLPELLAADQALAVHVPEGEGKVESLRALGLVATCGVGGAGPGKWLDSYTRTLQGRHVVILPDNDEPGRKHAAEIAKSLANVAASVKVVELPGLAPKGDVIDWLRAGGTRAQLEALVVAAGDDGWRDPIPMGQSPAAVFPLNVLPRALALYAEHVAASMPCPVDLVAVAALVAAATAIGTTRQLRIKSRWLERPCLWCAIACDTGTKKSPALAAALEPLFIRQRQYKRTHQQSLEQYERDVLTHEAELAQFRREARGALEQDGTAPQPPTRPEQPVMQQLLTTETTVEAIAGVLEANPRGILLACDELTGWVAGLNQYKAGKGSDRQKWLSFWTGADVVINRKSGVTHVSRPLINVVGCLPPDVLSDLHDENGREDGFVHRILFAWPDALRPRFSDLEPHPDVVSSYRDLFDGLLALEPSLDPDTGDPEPVTIGFTREARLAFADFVNALGGEVADEDHPDCLRGPWTKLEGYCARLALVLHVCRHVSRETESADVDEASVMAAIRLVDYFKANAMRVYPRLLSNSRVVANQDAWAVLRWMQRHRDAIEQRGNTFRWREVRHDLHHRFDDRPEDLKTAMEVLQDRGFVEEFSCERNGKVGRLPSPSYTVNPRVWCQNDYQCSKLTDPHPGEPISVIENHFGTIPTEEKNGEANGHAEVF